MQSKERISGQTAWTEFSTKRNVGGSKVGSLIGRDPPHTPKKCGSNSWFGSYPVKLNVFFFKVCFPTKIWMDLTKPKQFSFLFGSFKLLSLPCHNPSRGWQRLAPFDVTLRCPLITPNRYSPGSSLKKIPGEDLHRGTSDRFVSWCRRLRRRETCFWCLVPRWRTLVPYLVP